MNSGETLRRNADDREWMIVDPDGPPNHISRGTQPPLPETVADHRDRVTITHAIFLGQEKPAERRLQFQQIEVSSGDHRAIDRLRLVVDDQVHR